MKNNQKAEVTLDVGGDTEVQFLRMALAMCDITTNDRTADMIIRLTKLVMSKKGKTNIYDVTKIMADIEEAYPKEEPDNDEGASPEPFTAQDAQEVVGAWESLSGGTYEGEQIENWLYQDMAPVINKLRAKLKEHEG